MCMQASYLMCLRWTERPNYARPSCSLPSAAPAAPTEVVEAAAVAGRSTPPASAQSLDQISTGWGRKNNNSK